MEDSAAVADLVTGVLDEFLDGQDHILASVSADTVPLRSICRRFLSGGKRLRARFCWWGWRAAGGAAGEGGRPVLDAAAALETFHAAALVHDDILDGSDTRRGAPSAHRELAGLHLAGGFEGDADDFGAGAAILVGDLLLGFSDELMDRAVTGVPAAARAAARAEFARMRTEVTAGQYLDILDERAWRRVPDDEALERARTVLVHKSAKYSVQAPLVTGARLAGADDALAAALAAYGLPLGIAFQLRDDVLGVVGDARVTGKPSGDDIREGKRTVLVALARASLDERGRTRLDALLGDRDLDDAGVGEAQRLLADSGALARVEERIGLELDAALAALDAFDAPVARALAQLADEAVRRSA